MKKLILFILLALSILSEASSQSCLPLGITFSTQAEIDNFSVNYPNCTTIEGNVSIGGEGGTTITNLSGLIVLTSIEGYLNIYFNYELMNLSGLDNIENVGGSLSIIHNHSLSNVSGLNNLETIGGYLEIIDNIVLEDLSGLTSLNSIVGLLQISNNNILNDITGLSNLNSISSNVGHLIITQNNSLTNLNGIDNINASSIGYLHIGNNSYLTYCEVKSVCEYLTDPNSWLSIQDNASGCNTPDEVKNACIVLGTNTIRQKELDIYFNHAKKELNISNTNSHVTYEIVVYNQLGQKVLHKKGISNKIDISSIEQGMYIIELLIDNYLYRQKILIK